jgi:hypothetical protein
LRNLHIWFFQGAARDESEVKKQLKEIGKAAATAVVQDIYSGHHEATSSFYSFMPSAYSHFELCCLSATASL